jgi:signal recognition particle receptor subunit beta
MFTIDYQNRLITLKIVYYGPGLCGKTANIMYIHDNTSAKVKGKLVKLETEAERTLFFDFMPLSLGEIKGFRTKLQLYTTPGQIYYHSSRKMILRHVSGVVFVADSQPERMDANEASFDDLVENLKEHHLDINTIPLVYQWNKRDIPHATPVEELSRKLNRLGRPEFLASAVNGHGVFDTLKAISRIVLQDVTKGRGP